MAYDPHAKYVAEIRQQGQWWALIRYGLAHPLHLPALEAAVDILRGESGDRYATLLSYLETFIQNPLEPREAPDFSDLDLAEPQQISLALIATFPRLALCEIAGQFPAAQQMQLFQIGLQAAGQWKTIGSHVGDGALSAAASLMEARARLEVMQLEAAVASFEEAQAIYRQLAEARPDVYLPDVAMTLNNLGNVQRNLSRFEDAVASFEEARKLYETLASLLGSSNLMERIGLYCNLAGLVQREEPDLVRISHHIGEC